MRERLGILFAVSAAALGWGMGCDASPDDDAGVLDASSSMDASSIGDAGETMMDSGSSPDGGLDGGEAADACMPVASAAAPLPLDVMILVDQSGSMDDPVAGGGTKWIAMQMALSQHLDRADLGPTSFGVQYFALANTMCPSSCITDVDCGGCGPCLFGSCLGAGGDSCNAADYATPEVEVAALPGVRALIVTSLANHAASTASPTLPALTGVLQHARALADASPTHRVGVLLITDGYPTECGTEVGDVYAVAAAALTDGTSPIRTSVLALGPTPFSTMLAVEGGTTPLDVDITMGDTRAQILDRLAELRASQGVACAYARPAGATPGLAVRYTPTGGASQMLLRVSDEAGCPADGAGWYDGATNAIQLCAGVCATLGSDATALVETLDGC